MSVGSTNRQVDKSLSSYVTPISILGVTFGTDGGDDILIVQLDDFCTMVAESDPAALIEWIFLRYISASGVQRVNIDALEPQAPNASGSVFWLRMAADIGQQAGAWSLSLPVLQQFVKGRSGGKLHAALDVDGGFLPPGSAGRFTTFSKMGNATANNWQMTGASITGATEITVTTNDANNSPFTIISASGWTLSAGNSVTGVVDAGGGNLTLTTANPPAANDMLGLIGNNPDLIAADGSLCVTGFDLV